MSALGLMLCYWCLDILNNFIFGFVFQKWSLIGQWSMHVNRGDTHNMHAHHCSLPPYLHGSIPSAPWAQNFSEFTMRGSSVRLKASIGKQVRSITKGRHWQSWEACFPFEPELALNAESKHWCSKKCEWPRNPIIFLFVLLLFNSQPLILKVMTEGKRKGDQ